jgi:hypothetical protein
MENNDILVLGRIGLYRGDKDIFGEFERIKTSKRNYYSLKDSDYYVLKVLSVLNNPYDPEFMQTFEFLSRHYGIIFLFYITNCGEGKETLLQSARGRKHFCVRRMLEHKRIRKDSLHLMQFCMQSFLVNFYEVPPLRHRTHYFILLSKPRSPPVIVLYYICQMIF